MIRQPGSAVESNGKWKISHRNKDLNPRQSVPRSKDGTFLWCRRVVPCEGMHLGIHRHEKARAIFILAMNQLTRRKTLTKISEWFRWPLLYRPLSMDIEK